MGNRAAAVVVGVLVVWGLMVTARANGQAPTWVGTKVVLKSRTPLRVGRQVVNDDDVFRVYSVERVDGDWLWLVAGTVAGWVRSGQVVPLDQAIDFYTREIDANPTASLAAHLRRASVLMVNGATDAALADYTESINLEDTDARAFALRANAWVLKGEIENALVDLDEAVRLDPNDWNLCYRRGLARMEAGRPDHLALADFTEAIRLDPTAGMIAAGLARGTVWGRRGEFAKAIGDFEAVVRLDPDNAVAHHNLAYIRATCPDAHFRAGPDAVALATRACALSPEPTYVFLATLAAACAEAGDFASAVKWQEKANGLPGDEPRKKGGDERLALFKARKPFHDAPAGPVPAVPAAASRLPASDPEIPAAVPAPAPILPAGRIATVTNTIGMKLVRIPEGEFLMGSPDSDEDASSGEKPQRRVRITRPFLLGTTEVTVGQFRKVAGATGLRTEAETDGKGGRGWDEAMGELTLEPAPKYSWRNPGFAQFDAHPVVNVSWNDAVAFCNKLSALEGLEPYYRSGPGTRSDGDGYRLPTEAEWEYACRAGTTTRYPAGDDPESLALAANVADGTFGDVFADVRNLVGRDGYVFTAPAGRFPPNGFGLHDLTGNVWEWCWDEGALLSLDGGPSPPAGPEVRVIRGGSWTDWPQHCRASARSVFSPSFRGCNLGFRVARFSSAP